MQQDQTGAFHVGVIMDGNGRWAESRECTGSSGTRAARGA